MKIGLRVQIVLLLGGLMLLAFGPLFHAVATYSSFTLYSIGRDQAVQLADAITLRLRSDAIDSSRTLEQALEREVALERVVAVGVFDPQGKLIVARGQEQAVEALQAMRFPTPGRLYEIRWPNGRASGIRTTWKSRSVVAVLKLDDYTKHAARLVRLLSLYAILVAAALLLAAYFALTHLIVRPLGVIVSAGERMARGSRRFDVPTNGARELIVLGKSMRAMTERLLNEEATLKLKVNELERTTQQLSETQAGLIRSERLASVGRLAAGLAHEIGNPISAMLGLQDLMLEGGLNEAERQDFLARMRKETNRIHHILRDLLHFARPTSPAESVVAEASGDVARAIEDTVALVKPQKAFQDVDLRLEVRSGLPPVVLSRERLVQILLNLLLNAADACRQGGVVRVTAEETVSGSQHFVEIAVSDDGEGVLGSVTSHIFEPFVTTKEVGDGTGLGLSVCRGLVEAVGGSISLDDTHHPGARFVVQVPAA